MLDVANHTAADVSEQPRTVSKALADWFHYSVIRSRSGLFSEVVTVTPDMARLLLEGNEANRRVNDRHVKALASDIKLGGWDLNGESIKIATDGRLADGQHRLHAVILADAPIQTVVTFGVPYDSRLTTDQGLAKQVRDYLSMEHDTKYASLCAAVAGLLLRIRCGYALNGGNGSATKMRIRAEYEKFKAEIDDAVATVGHAQGGKAFVPQSMLATCLVVLRRKSPSADDFIEKLKTGENLSGTDPILKARETMIRSPRMTRDERYTLIIRAFDYWINNRTVSYFKVGKAGR